METWIIFAIFSALFAGLYSFAIKLVAQYNHDADKSLLYAYAISLLLSLVTFCLVDITLKDWVPIFFLAIAFAVTYYIAIVTRVDSLKNIHTTIYFPIYKTLGPVFVTITGVFVFHDNLSTFEIIGIFLGIIVPLLLISKSENARQGNLKKGLWLLLIGVIMTTLSAGVIKYLNVRELDQVLFLTSGFFFLVLIASTRLLTRKKLQTEFSKKYFWSVAIFAGIMHYAGFYTAIKAFAGTLSVAFTINAFSIIIPIVLSVWFFKEHMNFRKGFVIVLSIVSIIFFAF